MPRSGDERPQACEIRDLAELRPVSGRQHRALLLLLEPRILSSKSLGTAGAAEDVVQDACVRAYRGIGGFSADNARAWLLTIVRHTAYTWLRKYRSQTLVVVDDLEAVERAQTDPSEPGRETPETELIAKADA